MSSHMLPGTPAPEGKDRPYSQPIQWHDWEARFGVAMPYKTPTQEYQLNLYLPTMDDLMFRWEGIDGAIPEIYHLYNDPSAMLEREKIQLLRRREMGVPDFTDPEDVRIDTWYDIQKVQSRIDALNVELTTGYEKVVEVSGSLMGGFDRKEVRRQLSARSIAMKEDSLRRFIELKRLLREQATSIAEVRPGYGSAVRDQVRDALQDIRHSAGGYSWEEIQAAKTAPALPGGPVLEGEIISDERNNLVGSAGGKCALESNGLDPVERVPAAPAANIGVSQSA